MEILNTDLATGKQEPKNSYARYLAMNWAFQRSSSSFPTQGDEYRIDLMRNRDFKFQICHNKKCKTCPFANRSQVTNDKDTIAFCKLFNCIYMLECSVCQMAYVGQTSTPLHIRLNVHRNKIKNYDYNSSENQIEYEHFFKHGFNSVIIHILDIIPNHTDRIYYENKYILKKNTLFPYGLNQILNGQNIIKNDLLNTSAKQQTVYSIMNPQSQKTTRNQRGIHKNKHTINLDFKTQINNLNSQFENNYDWQKIRNWVFSIKKQNLNKLYIALIELNNKKQFGQLVFDLLLTRARQLGINLQHIQQKEQIKQSYCVINYSNPIFNYINLTNIFERYESLLPIKNVNTKKAYKYPLPLGRRIYNYNILSKQLNTSVTCSCSESSYQPYIDPNHGHVITGNLNIIKDPHLQQLLSYGSKYRLPLYYNKKKIIQTFANDLDKYIYKLSCKYHCPIEAFKSWHVQVTWHIKHLIQQLPIKQYTSNYNDIKNEIRLLQEKFVITYVDKASCNYAFICKKYYMDELKLQLNTSVSLTPIKTNISIIKKQIIAHYKLFKLKHNLNFPYIVLIPKFHKSPITFRTVTIGFNSYTNAADKQLLFILKQFYDQFTKQETHIIKNSFELIKNLKQLTHILDIKTYDFKDLFNNIDINDLYHVIIKLSEQFNNTNHVSNPNFKKLLKFILYNQYISQGNSIYKLNKGIPQGGISSTILANLYLHFYEIQQTFNSHVMYRFIDDIIIFKVNNYGPMLNFQFYPHNLQLIENVYTSTWINFLDVSLNIQKGNKIKIKIYDKTDNYNFKVNKLQHFSSNLSKSVFKNIINNQLLRIKQLNNTCYYKENIINLIKTTIQNKYPPYLIHSFIKTHFKFKFNTMLQLKQIIDQSVNTTSELS